MKRDRNLKLLLIFLASIYFAIYGIMYDMNIIVLLDTALQIFIAVAVISLIAAFVVYGLSGRFTFFKFKKKKGDRDGGW